MEADSLSKTARKNRRRREKKAAERAVVQPVISGISAPLVPAQDASSPPVAPPSQDSSSPATQATALQPDDYETDFYKLPGGGFLTKEVIVFLRDVMQGRARLRDFRQTLCSDDMRHLKNPNFQPLFSFAKLNAIARAVITTFRKGIPLPDALAAAPPFHKDELEGTFRHDDLLWQATIVLQNIPLSRGGALLGVTFRMPNDGFLYYDPEDAPHPKAPSSVDLQGAVKIQSAQHGSRFHQGTLGWYTLPPSLLATGALKDLQDLFVRWLRTKVQLPPSPKLQSTVLYNYELRRVDVEIETTCGGNVYQFQYCFERGLPVLDKSRLQQAYTILTKDYADLPPW